jgi:hypothetical protein|tara:strand:+ start:525 stop:722 length:198 start_codon:yes stop_codon:yes gene_type:complete
MNLKFDHLPKNSLNPNQSFAKKILYFLKKLKKIIFTKVDPKAKKYISIDAIEYLQIGVPDETEKK